MSLKRWFCKLIHSHARIQYAGYGATYTCRSCGCTHPVPWADTRGREGRVIWTVDEGAA